MKKREKSKKAQKKKEILKNKNIYILKIWTVHSWNLLAKGYQ